MKFEKNEKYASIAVYTFLVIVASVIFYLFISDINAAKDQFSNIMRIFTPITSGFVMAYLFNFILVLIEDKALVKLKMKNNHKRFLSLLITYILIGFMVTLFFQFIFPQLISSLVGLANDIPGHVRDIGVLINEINEEINFNEEFYAILIKKFNEFTEYIIRLASDLLPKIGDFTMRIISSISNVVLGLIISIYVLIDKEKLAAQSRKLINSIFPLKGANKTLELFTRANKIFGKFISGKILDSFIVAILTFLLLKLFKMPYSMLVSFIIGVTNIIPFFGPFIGAIPSFFIILFISPQKAIIFLMLIVVIQQIDGNIIGPKILGSSLGISPFWILFSLLVSGKIFGFIGLIIGVPLFVFVYSIIKDLVELRLKKKDLPIDTNNYRE